VTRAADKQPQKEVKTVEEVKPSKTKVQKEVSEPIQKIQTNAKENRANKESTLK